MNKYLQAIVIPSATFILGIILQTLLQKWLDQRDPLLLSLSILIFSVTIVLIISVYSLNFIDKRFDFSDNMLVDISKRTGLIVEYIEDGNSGKSYQRTTELLRNSQSSLTFVDYWEPYRSYQKQANDVPSVRSDYYNEVKKQVDRHKSDKDTFHRRIVQIPPSLMNVHIPFETDPAFLEYLIFTENIQRHYPTSCKIKLASASIRMPFIVVDKRYVVLPILTSDSSTQKQTRHGALFFDDRQGDLIKCMMSIYKIIDAHASPLEAEALMESK